MISSATKKVKEVEAEEEANRLEARKVVEEQEDTMGFEDAIQENDSNI